MDRQAREARESAKKLPFGKKVSYIWQYYKAWILTPLIIILVIGYTVYEIKSRPDYDLEATFYSESYVSDEQILAMEEYLSQFVEDRNKDGIQNIKLHLASVAMMDNEIEGVMAIHTKFSTDMAAGGDPVLLVDSAFHEVLENDVYAQAIETPRELTAISEIREIFPFPEGIKVYWVTRAVYHDKMDDAEVVELHETAVLTENNIFAGEN